MASATLNSLSFHDIYIRVDKEAPAGAPSWYHPKAKRGANDVKGTFRIPADFDDDIDLLRAKIKKIDDPEFGINHQGMRLRVAQYDIANGHWIAACRRLNKSVPSLTDLNFTPDILKQMRKWGTRPGLVLIGGGTCQGKTTTAVSLLKEFLMTHGGTLYTLEDPVEYEMNGSFSANNLVIQREVRKVSDWENGLMTAFRSHPDYIFLGEIRSKIVAAEVLRACISGHTVVCTTHGSSIEDTLGAMLQLAEKEMGETAAEYLANGLTSVVYQEIQKGRPVAKIVETEQGKYSDIVRNAIRQRKFSSLGTQVDRQAVVRGQVGTNTGSGSGIEVPPKKRGILSW